MATQLCYLSIYTHLQLELDLLDDLHVELLDWLQAAKLASWTALGLQVGVLDRFGPLS